MEHITGLVLAQLDAGGRTNGIACFQQPLDIDDSGVLQGRWIVDPGVVEGIGAVPAEKFARLPPHLDEGRRRLVLGADVRALGHGGIRKVGEFTQAGEPVIGVDSKKEMLGQLCRTRTPVAAQG